MPEITIEEVEAQDFPMVKEFGMNLEEIGKGSSRIRLPYRDLFGRPGGTVNGPAMMCLADYAMYVAIMSIIGLRLDIVTSNLTANFLKRPKARDLIAQGKVLRCGRKLVFGTVEIFSEGEMEQAVAHITCTYAI